MRRFKLDSPFSLSCFVVAAVVVRLTSEVKVATTGFLHYTQTERRESQNHSLESKEQIQGERHTKWSGSAAYPITFVFILFFSTAALAFTFKSETEWGKENYWIDSMARRARLDYTQQHLLIQCCSLLYIYNPQIHNYTHPVSRLRVDG